MENINAPYDFVVSGNQNWSEEEEYTQGGPHNDDSDQVPSELEVQEPTASSLEEEDVLKTNDEREQAISNFDLDYSTQHPTAISPDIDHPFDTQRIHHSATGLGAGPSADVPQPNANRSFLSAGQRAQNDNNYGPIHREPGTYSGENECGNSNSYYIGMDSQWHQCVPPQNLQTGGSSYLDGADQYGTQQTSSAYPVSYIAASIHSHHPLGAGEGSLLEYLRRAHVQIPQQIQQSRPHTASIQTTFGISQRPTASNYKPNSRSSHGKSPSRASSLAAEATTSSNQQATPTSQSDSGLYSHRPFTDEDFLPKIRKGGKLMEDGVTWNKEAQKNHYDCWARYHGRPALPKAVEGGLSEFKLRSNAIKALNEADQESLQYFINAAKYFAVTGNPNRPSNRQAANNLESGDEDESEKGSMNRPGVYQVIAPKKRAREETEESPVERRKHLKSKSTVGLGNSRPESQPSIKNPQGQMSFHNMEAANQWLASLGQPSMLEAANTYLANRGVPSIVIGNLRLMGLSSSPGYPYVNKGSQRGSVAPFPAGVNGHSVGVPGSLLKKPCTKNAGITNIQSSNQAAPRRQEAQATNRTGSQKQHLAPAVRNEAPNHTSNAVESSSLSFGSATGATLPDAYERIVSAESGYLLVNSSFGPNFDDPSRHASSTPGSYQSSAPVGNSTSSDTGAPSSHILGQASMENDRIYQLASEVPVDEGHENNQASDYGQYWNLEELGFYPSEPSPAEQENLANFDFGISVAEEQEDVGDFASSFLDDD